MIGQVINVTGIQLDSLKALDAGANPKLLPAENSLVEVSVLDKSNGNYRLLIEGNVFQSKLPVNVNVGEALIARVIGSNPFTLSLDRIFSAKMLSGSNIALVLSKLGIEETGISQQVLKAFLKEEKPLVKSKLKKVIEMLEHEDVKLSEEMLSLLIQMLHMEENRGSFQKKSYVKLFQYPLETLSEEILSSLRRLNKMGVPEEALLRINKALMLEGEDFSALEVKEKSAARAEDILDEVKAGAFSEGMRQEISGLKEILTRFNMLRACYMKAGVYPGFIIIKSGDEIEMAEYRLESESDGKGQKSYRIKLDMEPGLLGKVAIKGFLSGQNLNASFSASEESVKDLEEEKESLLFSLGRLNLTPRISFGNPGKTGGDAPGEIIRQINVRV